MISVLFFGGVTIMCRLKLAVLLCVPCAVLGLRQLELITETGEVVIPTPEANCQACKAVVSSLERSAAKPIPSVPGGGGALSKEKRKQRGDYMTQELMLAEILDADHCGPAMKECEFALRLSQGGSRPLDGARTQH